MTARAEYANGGILMKATDVAEMIEQGIAKGVAAALAANGAQTKRTVSSGAVQSLEALLDPAKTSEEVVVESSPTMKLTVTKHGKLIKLRANGRLISIGGSRHEEVSRQVKAAPKK